jgi:hypothetical protein
MTTTLSDLINRKEPRCLSNMEGYSTIPPDEKIAEFIPTVINVVTELPKQDAPYGLNYYMPLANKDVVPNANDMRRILHHLYMDYPASQSRVFHGSGILHGLFPTAQIHRLSAAELDEAYSHNYNIFHLMPGQGVLLSGTQLSKSRLSLQEIFSFHYILSEINAMFHRSNEEYPIKVGAMRLGDEEVFQYAAHQASHAMQTLLCNTCLYKGEVVVYGATKDAFIKMTTFYRDELVFKIEFDGLHLQLIALGQVSCEMIKALRTLNPTHFNSTAIGVEDMRFAFYRPELKLTYPIILLDESAV